MLRSFLGSQSGDQPSIAPSSCSLAGWETHVCPSAMWRGRGPARPLGSSPKVSGSVRGTPPGARAQPPWGRSIRTCQWVTRGFCPPGTLQSTQLGYLRGWLQPRVFLDAEWAGAQARATLASPLRLPQCPLCLLLERRAPSLGDIKRGPRRPTPNTHATHPRPPQARSLGPHERGPCHPHRERRGP